MSGENDPAMIRFHEEVAKLQQQSRDNRAQREAARQGPVETWPALEYSYDNLGSHEAETCVIYWNFNTIDEARAYVRAMTSVGSVRRADAGWHKRLSYAWHDFWTRRPDLPPVHPYAVTILQYGWPQSKYLVAIDSARARPERDRFPLVWIVREVGCPNP